MSATENVRIDKFLWAVRLFKTRSIASEACKKSRVTINGAIAKSSRTINIGDVISIRIAPITRSFEVIDVAEKRMGAKFTPNYIKDVTSADQLEILELTRLTNSQGRRKGLGRPTKRDRRDLERLTNEEWNL